MTLVRELSDFLKAKKNYFIPGMILLLVGCEAASDKNIGQTAITKWQGNKKAAISITFDDGIVNQLTVARPILNKLGMPGTFYIITGKVEGSGQGKFIGRSKDEIIRESATITTNTDNFFERASLIGFTGTSEGLDYHSTAGSLFESGKIKEAYEVIDEAYSKLRKGELKDSDEVVYHDNKIDTTSWNDYRSYAAEGHEIGSHTVTHARLAVLDEANLLYELQQSKADIQKNLGEKYTFSAECPYGTENERVMQYATTIYPALRNRMPAPYLEEINRSGDLAPGASDKEYVQWQRGPLTDTSMEMMQSWVDTCLVRDNIWLVLVFHGVDGIGWESKTEEELFTYFNYIKEKDKDLWVATFGDVAKYIRERKSMEISNTVKDNSIEINLSSSLDPKVYDVPLTLKTYVPGNWKNVVLKENSAQSILSVLTLEKDVAGSYVEYTVSPGISQLVLMDEL